MVDGLMDLTLSGNSLRQTVHTHPASVHQAAKLAAALLRVARVTVGLAESNGSLPPDHFGLSFRRRSSQSICWLGTETAFAWIGAGAYIVTLVFSTTALIKGRCAPYSIFENKAAKFFHYIWYFLSFYVTILFIFIFCYGRILIVIRRQAKVMASHNAPQNRSSRIRHSSDVSELLPD